MMSIRFRPGIGGRTATRLAVAASLFAGNCTCFTVPPPAWTLDVVDVTPADFSDESFGQPEPTIAVNPVDPNVIAMTAFYVGNASCGATDTGGILISLDGGMSWSLRCALPLHWGGASNKKAPSDVTLKFTGDGSKLIAAYLSKPNDAFNHLARVVEITGWETVGTTVATELTPTAGMRLVDQPRVAVSPVGTTFAVGVAENDGVGNSNGCPGVVIWWWRGTATQNEGCATDRPPLVSPTYMPIRPAIDASGRLYGVYLHQNGADNDHLVLVRGLLGDPPPSTLFNDLTDDTPAPGFSGTACIGPDTKIGVRLKPCRYIPTDAIYTPSPPLGNQVRSANQMAIALDPRDVDFNNQRVYIAYGDAVGTDLMTLHLVASDHGGKAIDRDEILVIHNGINPTLAVDKDGNVGFLYQQFTQRCAYFACYSYWETHIQVSDATQSAWTDHLLSSTVSFEPPYSAGGGFPYIGDYVDLMAVGNIFYGVFSADNNPGYHPTARYLRYLVSNAWGDRELPSGVAPSIDPFFFRLIPPVALSPAMTYNARIRTARYQVDLKMPYMRQRGIQPFGPGPDPGPTLRPAPSGAGRGNPPPL